MTMDTGFPKDQIEELKKLHPYVKATPEGGIVYFLIPELALEGCSPQKVSTLLCPVPRDGYPFRLFFSTEIASPRAQNWNAKNTVILNQNWFAFSLKIPESNFRLAQMIAIYVNALR